MIDVRFSPLQLWPFPETKSRRGWYAFKASWSDTLELLDRELRHLGARDCIIEAFFRDSDLRLDGWPRSDARAPEHPGVIVTFGSKHGQLRYGSDSCPYWQHNIRSIGLGLESLRAVDRYGITRTGEQYTGWKALGAGEPIAIGQNGTFASADEAAGFILEHCETSPDVSISGVLRFSSILEKAYKRAAKALHPDAGGDPELFKRLNDAKRLVESVQR